MSDTLKGKVAVVTGSGGGIGRAVALLMAAEGAKVVVNDLGAPPSGDGGSPAMADETVALIRAEGGEAVPVYDSVATMEGARNIIGAAIDSFGRIDCLVNNAGNTRVNMVWDMPEEDFDAVVQTHLKGTFCTDQGRRAPHDRAAERQHHQRRLRHGHRRRRGASRTTPPRRAASSASATRSASSSASTESG